MDISDTICSFRNFLNVSWKSLPALIKDREKSWDAVDDWFQANWETLVETEINLITERGKQTSIPIRIPPFGDGADCYGTSSRVFLPDAKPTHYILVNETYRFDSFGTLNKNHWFEIRYPFDYVKAFNNNEEEVTLPTENLKYSLIAFSKNEN